MFERFVNNPWTIIVVLCVFALCVWRFGAHRLMFGAPNLRLEELGRLLRDRSRLSIYQNPDVTSSETTTSLRFRDQTTSVIYTRKDSPGFIIETLDINHTDTFGMILLIVNNELNTFQRIGGRSIVNPTISPEQHGNVFALLERIRGYASIEG